MACQHLGEEHFTGPRSERLRSAYGYESLRPGQGPEHGRGPQSSGLCYRVSRRARAPVKVASREDARSFAICLKSHGIDAELKRFPNLSLWQALVALGLFISPIGWASTAAVLRSMNQDPAYSLDRHEVYFLGNKVKKRRFFQRLSLITAYAYKKR